MGYQERLQEIEGSEVLESFEYVESPDARLIPSWEGWGDATDAAAGQSAQSGAMKQRAAGAGRPGEAEFNRRLEEQTRLGFESGRAQGVEEGRKAERQARDQALAAEEEKRIRQGAALVEKFANARECFFKILEPEVVRLAIAVSARILRREAASDPLLLLGAVRAALGQMAGATEVRLRVPAAELDLWTEAVKLVPNPAVRPAVVVGEGMSLGDCAIEAALGSADLGIAAQLAEVERVLLTEAARPEQQPGRLSAQVEQPARCELAEVESGV